MRRRTLLAALAAATAPAWGAAAQSAGDAVPVPDGFAFACEHLDLARKAIGRGALSLMTIGGRPAGTEAGGSRPPPPSYARSLLARLSAALPTVTIRLDILAIARTEIPEFERQLTPGLARFRPDLVVWGPGGTAAARGDDLVSFHEQLRGTIHAVRGAGADLILMTPQFAPVLARLTNLPPYRTAVLQEAEDAGIPVLDRYELMRFWSENQDLDLDATQPEAQLAVAIKVHDWIARLLTEGIVRAVA